MEGVKPARTFSDLLVWKKAHQFVLAAYKLSVVFPEDERYGLRAQLRRAAVSIPANIAEGFKRRGRADKVRFMNMAQGSLEECRYYLVLAQDLHYASSTLSLRNQMDELSRMLQGYLEGILRSNDRM